MLISDQDLDGPPEERGGEGRVRREDRAEAQPQVRIIRPSGAYQTVLDGDLEYDAPLCGEINYFICLRHR